MSRTAGPRRSDPDRPDPRESVGGHNGAQDAVYRFGRCELDPRARELRRDGQPHPLEPLVFDLLSHLLRHRDRVVPKDELFDEVWLGRIVTPGALARAIMTLRQAIGDGGPEPLVATAHRVGYRFCGTVTVLHREPPAAHDDAPRSVALLPIDNLTGNPALQWVPVGLACLVGHALAVDPRLVPLGIDAIRQALRPLPRDAGFVERSRALQRLGVEHVVQARVVRLDRHYRLDYRCRDARGETIGSVSADEPLRLGRALARRLAAHLLPGAPHEVDGFQVHDASAMLVFARAMQAIQDGRREDAAHMLSIVLDLEPDYGEARAALARLTVPHGTRGSALASDRQARPRVFP